jgi:hypothetical protein
MNRRYALFTLLCAIVFIFTLLSSEAQAGWVEVNKHSGTSYISDNKVKQVPRGEGESWSIFDANSGTITVVEPDKKSYMVIDPEELCKELSSMMEAMMSQVPPDQRAAMEQMLQGQSKAKKTAPAVTVKRLGDGDSIAGFETVRYNLMVDSAPYKDIWLAKDGPSMEEVQELLKSVVKMFKKMEGCTKAGGGLVGANPELSKEYMGLMEKGWTMKEVNLQNGSVVSEVQSLKRKDIPASEFAIPAGYRLVDIMEMMGQMQK